MHITSFEFEDLATGWTLKPMEFDRLNLLVGASGAGKTRILEALQRVCGIPEASSLPSNVKWELNFELEGSSYTWNGKTEFPQEYKPPHSSGSRSFGRQGHITKECLEKGGEKIFERHDKSIDFKDTELPRIRPDKSLINILSEKEVSLVGEALSQINSEKNLHLHYYENQKLKALKDKFSCLDGILGSDLSLDIKLYFLDEYRPSKINKIAEEFSSIFPSMEKIKLIKRPMTISTSSGEEEPGTSISLHIEEDGVENPIRFHDLAGGMRRTLLWLLQLHLAPEHRTLLIDEVENSMGVNCLGDMVDELMRHARDIQFVLTSHHPYIINNIPSEYWKIVTREGSTVTVHDAEDVPSLQSETNQSKFTQLLNSDFFVEGIE